MRIIRLHVVLSKGRWGRRISPASLKMLLDRGTVISLDVQRPDEDVLCDFIITYLQDVGLRDVHYALVSYFQPEFESMVDVLIEGDYSV